ncbi:ABC transporter permease, partial [Saccharomonospora saliphila]|uniref:ABC transporter permease n=1 Tax=Saccharomonospora saliphila TaxID=369829 RepID=UPI00035EAAD8
MSTATTEMPGPVTARAGGSLTGTGHLVRLALRRDRILLPVWFVVLALTPAGTVGAYEQLYPTRAEREALTTSMGGNPSITLLYGPAHDLSTAGGFTAWRYGTLLPLFLALACVFVVTRHTRQEEDTGRQELLSSTVVGRYAPLTAALLVGAGLSLATGLAASGAMVAAGMAASGSLAFGLGMASVGLVFTGVAGVTAQIAEYSRTANGLAGAALGVTFALRAIGDSTTGLDWLSWLSPIGWATQVRAFTDDRFTVLLLPLIVTCVLVGVACALRPRRDVGLGLLPATLGPSGASPRLRTTFALAVRLHRAMLTGWLSGFVVLGALFGSLASGMGDIVGDSAEMRRMLARMGGSEAVVDAYLATIANFAGMVAALFAVQAVLRMRAEETAVRAEPLLATGVGRLRWLAGHLVFVFTGSAALVLAAGVSIGALHGARVGDVGGETAALLGACLAQLPAVWVVAAAAVALFGLVPAFTTAAWAIAALAVLISMFGPVLDVGQLVLDLSPFEHVPRLPGAEVRAAPFVWLGGVAAVLLAAGS